MIGSKWACERKLSSEMNKFQQVCSLENSLKPGLCLDHCLLQIAACSFEKCNTKYSRNLSNYWWNYISQIISKN